MSYRLSNSYYRPYNPLKYWNAAVYIRLSKEDLEKAKHIKDFSNSVENQLNMLKSYVEQHNDLKLIDIYIDATVIIGLKQNPTYGRRFSPIFLLYRAFCGAKRRMSL